MVYNRLEIFLGRDLIEKVRTLALALVLVLFLASVALNINQQGRISDLQKQVGANKTDIADATSVAQRFVMNLTTYDYIDVDRQTLALTDLATPSVLAKVKSDQSYVVLSEEVSKYLTAARTSYGVDGNSGSINFEVQKSYFNRLHPQQEIKIDGMIFCNLVRSQGEWRVSAFIWGEINQTSP
jgi:uncharacterized protein YdeI (BOF family)